MRHVTALVATALVAALSAASLAAQAQAPVSVAPVAAAVSAKVLPPIPSARQFQHWGQIETSYDEEENSTSISLSLTFDGAQRDAFARPGRGVEAVEMQVGFVFAGKVMTTAPELATLLIKLTRATDVALDFDKKTVGDMHIVLDGTEPVVIGAPLVQRNAVVSSRGRVRKVQDTYAVVFTLPQFLRVVNGEKVTSRMGDQIFDFTGGPIEGMREVASRIAVTP